jgi:two-component sensor histidine kinase
MEILPVAEDVNAFNQLLSELVARLLSMADSPGKSADYLAESLRNLIGARTVMVMQCPQQTHHEKHDIVSVFPDRRYALGKHQAVQELCNLSHGFDKATLFWSETEADRPGTETAIHAALRRLESGPAIISPLQSGGTRMGVLLLLDLMDPSGLKTILDTLDRLSTVMALVLRNAFLYNNLEEIVARRTRQLELHSAALAASLRERDVMLKEVHHRVKNNLQVVNSLLYLQANSSEDPELREALRKGQQRILSMAMIHEELYRSEDLSSVDMCAYTQRLCDGFAGMSEDRIHLHCQTGQLLLPITQSIPCGLILNEFLTNALKYAYPEGQEGEIRVRVTEEGGLVNLVVEDDGVGLPPGFGDASSVDVKPGSLGLTLVHGLVDQLKGTLTVSACSAGSEGSKGARFAVSFGREGHE